MSPDELAQIKKLEGDLLEECTKRVEAEAKVRNLERINRALGEVVERQWHPIERFKHTNECWMFCDERGNRWIDTGPDMFHINGCGFPATHFRELPSPPGAGT